MTQPNMELQAIREKLQSLRSDPSTAEAIPLPWSQRASVDEGTAEDKSRQEMAIEALKQRSHGAESAQTYSRQLIAQELYRLEVQANLINEQSQRQAETLLALRQSAQQASIGLQRQGVQSHPSLSIITQFLDGYSSAVVPHIERDSHGYFALSYHTVDFQCAERDATETAHALRSRGKTTGLQRRIFSALIPNEISGDCDEAFDKAADSSALDNGTLKGKVREDRTALDSSYTSAKPAQSHRMRKNRLRKSVGNIINRMLALFSQNKQKKRKRSYTGVGAMLSATEGSKWRYSSARVEKGVLKGDFLEEGFLEEGFLDIAADSNRLFYGRFSWLDGTIWFSGAAIARIVVQMMALHYPTVQTLFVIAIATAITFALYQVIINRSNDYSLVYRLCIAMAGLMLSSLFRL